MKFGNYRKQPYEALHTFSGKSAPHPGRFTPRKDPVPIVQEAG